MNQYHNSQVIRMKYTLLPGENCSRLTLGLLLEVIRCRQTKEMHLLDLLRNRGFDHSTKCTVVARNVCKKIRKATQVCDALFFTLQGNSNPAMSVHSSSIFGKDEIVEQCYKDIAAGR
jgi:hypothetical protein